MALLTDYPRYAAQVLSGLRARKEAGYTQQMANDLAPYLDLSQSRTILDVGSGQLRPQYSLLRGAGHRVVGIDFVNRPNANWKEPLYQLMRRIYTRQLGLPARASAAGGLLTGDVGQLPLADHQFDLAVSNAAFEHFLELPKVLGELKRVLKPGGMLWIGVHLFTSPSGGHNVSFTQYPLRSLPPNTEPWDHLRKRTRPWQVPLNEWRRSQYEAAFREHFTLHHSYCALREGEQWLTPALERELSAYSRDELTCAVLVLIAQKEH